MLSWKEIIEEYIVKHADRIRKTTQPLRDHFGIGYRDSQNGSGGDAH